MPPIPKNRSPTILGVVPSTQGGLQADSELLQEIKRRSIAENRSKTILVLPDFVLLDRAATLFYRTTVLLGAWDISVKDCEAEGGIPDAKTLSDAGVTIVDMTHDEEKIMRKTEEVVKSGMKPLICMQASAGTSPSQQFSHGFENLFETSASCIGDDSTPTGAGNTMGVQAPRWKIHGQGCRGRYSADHVIAAEGAAGRRCED